MQNYKITLRSVSRPHKNIQFTYHEELGYKQIAFSYHEELSFKYITLTIRDQSVK